MRFFFKFKQKTSGAIARERLKQLLLSDRMNYGSEIQDKLSTDISSCISRYLEIDDKHIEIQYERCHAPRHTEESRGIHFVTGYLNIRIPVQSEKQER